MAHFGWPALVLTCAFGLVRGWNKEDAMEPQETALETWILHKLQVLGLWLSRSAWPTNMHYAPYSWTWQPKTFRHVGLGWSTITGRAPQDEGSSTLKSFWGITFKLETVPIWLPACQMGSCTSLAIKTPRSLLLKDTAVRLPSPTPAWYPVSSSYNFGWNMYIYEG